MIPYFSFTKVFVFQTWGLFLALGFLVPFLLVLKKAKKKAIDSNFVWDLFLWIVISSFIGMRLGYVLQFFDYFLSHPGEIIKVRDGGLTFYGGLLGGIIGIFLFKMKNPREKKVFWPVIDLIALYFPIGIVIARIGCFLINDHQGTITSLPWGIIWSDGVVRHPVALYLVLNGIFIFFLLNFIKSRLKKSGQLFYCFLLFYSVSRFLLDFTRSSRTVLSDPLFYGLTYSQWVALALIAVLVLIKSVNLVKARLKSSRLLN